VVCYLETVGATALFKANQPTLLEQVTAALAGTDAEFRAATWMKEGKGHGCMERRSVRAALPPASTGGAPPRCWASAATGVLLPGTGPARRSSTGSPASPGTGEPVAHAHRLGMMRQAIDES
jgi:hypothetical protein